MMRFIWEASQNVYRLNVPLLSADADEKMKKNKRNEMKSFDEIQF